MSFGEKFERMDERIRKLEKEVEALKADAKGAGTESGAAPEKKPRARKATGK